jgi:NADPH:quinone reductase-like Zn-dependent oxidoreductase
LLIEVKASSINPLDLWMSQGYGYSIFELMRSKTVENFSTFNPFPITLGRDFSGVVVDKGMNAGEFKVGDQVLIFFRRPLSFPGKCNDRSELFLKSLSILGKSNHIGFLTKH